MMTGGMSCGKMFRSMEPQADKKNKTVLTKRGKATQSRCLFPVSLFQDYAISHAFNSFFQRRSTSL